MMSHTINDTAWPSSKDSYSYSEANTNSEGPLMAPVQVQKTSSPREHGVVGIKVTDKAVAIGRVVAGIFLAFKTKKDGQMDINNFITDRDDYIALPNEMKSRKVNPLYLLTIADMLALTKWNEKQMGGNGVWKHVNNTKYIPDIGKDICPNVYELTEKDTSFYTYSSLRGAVDGVILGNLIMKNRDYETGKLSQLLRMYYSNIGIKMANSKESNSEISYRRRSQILDEWRIIDDIKKEIENAVYILSDNIDPTGLTKIQQRIDDAKLNFESTKGELQTDQDRENLSCDTPVDVLAVLDTSSNGFLEKQRMILGHLANKLHLWHQGSKLTVLLNKRNGTSGLGLEELLPETSSSPCAACFLLEHDIDNRQIAEPEIVIQSIDKKLQEKRAEESEDDGVPGKVVIYFNFDDDHALTLREEKVLHDLYLNHLDAKILAVGKSKELLMKFARNNDKNVFFGTESDISIVIKNLNDNICSGSADLIYTDCDNQKKKETGEYFEGLITPSTNQFWRMNPQYFHKSLNARIFFELPEKSGQINICHTRTQEPEISEKNCRELNSTTPKLEFSHANPCKGFSVITCSPMSFRLFAIEKKMNDLEPQMTDTKLCVDTENVKCKRLDQIKFKVTHEGIRCSGCLNLSSTIHVLVATLLSYFILTNLVYKYE